MPQSLLLALGVSDNFTILDKMLQISKLPSCHWAWAIWASTAGFQAARAEADCQLEIMLNNGGSAFGGPSMGFGVGPLLSPPSSSSPSPSTRKRSYLASPISPLEMLARVSPRSPMEEEERAIAEKGYYLHPSPLSTPRGSEPPELLPLFPLQSPTARNGSSSN
ncbi:hypothetical protein HAX54_019264 [Datura stramonium]|uniref:Uncharacterized protein n=1 Tax=Datura stramonium TaxID=4076 RepID=A0ABS8UPZ6_DATST|nr:hypothetical protein [Datura stramonium]